MIPSPDAGAADPLQRLIGIAGSAWRVASGFAVQHPVWAAASAVALALVLFAAGRVLRVAVIVAMVAGLVAVIALWATDSEFLRPEQAVHASPSGQSAGSH